jgi:hypothetical protein
MTPKCARKSTSVRHACIYGKSHCIQFESSKKNRASGSLDLVYRNDVCGPMHVSSLMRGSHYSFTFRDHHSKRSDARCFDAEKLPEFWVVSRYGRNVRNVTPDAKYIHFDRIMVVNTWRRFQRSFISRYSGSLINGTFHTLRPQQNGAAARLNRTLLNSTKSMLKHMNCDQIFRSKVATTACYVKNRVASTRLPCLPITTTPREICIGKTPTCCWSFAGV